MSCNCGGTIHSFVVRAVKNVATGAVGLTKYIARTGLAPSAVIAARRELCGKCEQNKLCLCLACNCLIPAKTSLIQEACPLDPPKW